MEFNRVRVLTIPEGNVEKITNSSGTVLWKRPHIYGVSWDGSSSPSMTRTDDSASFSTPTIGVGTTSGSSDFDNCYPWSDMKVETIDGNALVAIPKFWYKWTLSGSTLKLQICDTPIEGFYVSPMHANRGDGAGERDVAYIGKYKCASDYKSKAGYNPVASISINTARTKITALGDGYYQQDYAAFLTLRMLFLVEWATWDGQSVIANTSNFTSLSSILTGKTASMKYHTGLSSDGYSTQYRYVEDPWENFLEWIDGVYYSGANMYCINNPKNFAIGSNGTLVGTRCTTSSVYIKSWKVSTVSGYEWALIPATVTSSESYTMDGYYYTSTGTVLYSSGARSSWEVHGPWFMYTDFTATQTSTMITSRIMYLP